jgi:alkaline phosphatase D
MAPIVTLDPFTLGVAAGDPLPDSLILWTRLLPDVALPATDVEVEWELASDAAFGDIVAAGTTPAVAALGHSVHVDAGGLEPDREYHYRFRVAGFESAPGRARTFAAPGTLPARFRFAFSSCQHWEHGFYAAYRDLVEQDAVDAFVFLGDYIYESASGGGGGRSTGQEFECETLDQYRQRYALYHSDPLLQAAHARVPWIITWDDHEVDNNYAAAISERDDSPEIFLARRAAAYQAWYEHMPVRLDPPAGADYAIYRSFAHGDLLRFHVLDTRQYRSDQQRGEPFIESLGSNVQVRDEQLAASAAQTMLGEAQRDWLIDGVTNSTAVWDVVAQQVFMSGANLVGDAVPPVVLPDTWDGYAAERKLLVEAIGLLAENLVVLTGDFHSAAVADLRADPFDLSIPPLGSELMASSISSNFFDADATVEALASQALAGNPQLRWFDTRRGYTVCDVTPDRWHATFRVVVDQLDETSAVDVASTWEIAAGTPGPVQTS